MTTYVFFIGGTGARVLRSLTMLLASGVSIGENNKLVPIVIDYDAENGDLKLSKDLLANYVKLHNYAKYENNERGFFGANIDMQDYSMVNIKVDSDRNTFARYIDYQSLDQETRKFLDTLYDNSPIQVPTTELNLDLEVGFKGNPNIGSVVFNDYFRQEEYGYDDFEAGFPTNNEGSRVFIVGSIFGGTGSSGLPQLVKKFRSSNSISLKAAPIGTCVVLPYFNVTPDANSAINSETFNSKAKAALAYYNEEINDMVNEIYYIGCDSLNVPYGNVQGGGEQKNDAHLVELLSAMSVVEFATRSFDPNSSDYGKTKCYEYTTTTGIDEKDNKTVLKPISYLDLLGTSMKNDLSENNIYTKYVRHMNAFAYFNKYSQSYTFAGKDAPGFMGIGGQTYYKQLNKWGGLSKDSSFGRDLLGFLDAYEVWANQMAENSQLKFHPYSFDKKELDHLLNIEDTTTKIKGIENTMQLALSQANEKYSKQIVEGQEGGVFLRRGTEAGLAAADKKDK